MYQKTLLPNDLRIITVPMKETKAVTLYVVVKVGSRYEEKRQNGISHFLEHLFFKGTKKRPSTLLIAKELDGIGASYNAFTSEEMTGFFIQAEASKFSLILDVLYDILQNSLFLEEEIERERGVILEEANMYKDTPIKYIFDLYKQLLYGDTPLGRLIIGEPKQIKSFKRNDFTEYKEKFYTPAQMVLATAGRLNKEALKEIDQYFGKIPKGRRYEPPAVLETQKQPQLSLYYKKTDQAHLVLGYRSIKRASSLRYAQELLNVILGASMSSRLFLEIRERRGLCYHISSETWYFNDSGSLLVYAGVPIKKTEEAVKLILKEFLKIKEEGIAEEELQKAKDYLKGRMALRLESSYNQASFFADQELLLDDIKTPEEEIKEIEKVRQKDILTLAKEIIRPERLNLAIIGPFQDKEKFEKLLKV